MEAERDTERDVNVSSRASATSAWTFGTMYLFFSDKIWAMDRRVDLEFRELDRRQTAQLLAQKEAILKAEKATDDRFQSVNEFRNALGDLSNRMITRADVDSRLNSISEKIGDISARLDRSEGKGLGMTAIWGIILGGAGLFSIIVTVVLNAFRIVVH